MTWSRPGGWLLPTCQDSLGCAKWAGWGGAQASLEQDNTKETVLLKLLLHLIFCYQKMLLREWSSGNSLTQPHTEPLSHTGFSKVTFRGDLMKYLSFPWGRSKPKAQYSCFFFFFFSSKVSTTCGTAGCLSGPRNSLEDQHVGTP